MDDYILPKVFRPFGLEISASARGCHRGPPRILFWMERFVGHLCLKSNLHFLSDIGSMNDSPRMSIAGF
jgi:hypothetical protein